MRGLSRQFRRRVADDLEMFTNQPFTTPIALGDIGSIERGSFETSSASSLSALGIDIGTPVQGPPHKLQWQSRHEGSVSFEIKAQGTPATPQLAEAEAGVSLKFSGEGSYIFHAEDAVISRIEETPQLYRALAQARKDGRISRRDRIITSVFTASRVKIYISRSKEAELVLAANGDFGSLAEAGVDLKIRKKSGSILEVNLPPGEPTVFFMKLVRIRRWGDVRPLRSLEASLLAALPIDRMNFVGQSTTNDDVFVVEPDFPGIEDNLD